MTPDAIRAARQLLNMSHRQFGEALGVQEQTARRWEIASDKASNRQPSETVARLISVLLATNVTPDSHRTAFDAVAELFSPVSKIPVDGEREAG